MKGERIVIDPIRKKKVQTDAQAEKFEKMGNTVYTLYPDQYDFKSKAGREERAKDAHQAIDNADVLYVLNNPYYEVSDFINEDVEYAKAHGKTVIFDSESHIDVIMVLGGPNDVAQTRAVAHKFGNDGKIVLSPSLSQYYTLVSRMPNRSAHYDYNMDISKLGLMYRQMVDMSDMLYIVNKSDDEIFTRLRSELEQYASLKGKRIEYWKEK